MPLLALLCGVFAKAEPITRREDGKILTRLVVPHVIFNVICSVALWRVEGRSLLDLGSPYWPLWLLSCSRSGGGSCRRSRRCACRSRLPWGPVWSVAPSEGGAAVSHVPKAGHAALLRPRVG